MTNQTTNYVRVDEEGDTITVYDDAADRQCLYFGPDYYPSRVERRAAAEAAARKMAKQETCEWGTNYH